MRSPALELPHTGYRRNRSTSSASAATFSFAAQSGVSWIFAPTTAPRAPQQLRVGRRLTAKRAERGREDRRRHQEVKDAVLVVVERDPPFLRDRVEALPAGFVRNERSVCAKRLHGNSHQVANRIAAAVRARVEGRGVQELGAVEDLGLAQRPAVVTEQRGCRQPGRGERGGGVDSRGDAQAEVLHQLLLLIRSDG